jgi:hypothetical protein
LHKFHIHWRIRRVLNIFTRLLKEFHKFLNRMKLDRGLALVLAAPTLATGEEESLGSPVIPQRVDLVISRPWLLV